MYSDDYMATEVLCGRPAMVSVPFSRDVVRKYWLLHDAMGALALRRIDGFEFADGNLHRQRVRWDNGAVVVVNRGAQDWEAEGRTLAQYGFYARVPMSAGAVETAVEKRNGHVVEWARAPFLLYVNGRGAAADFGGVETAGACRLTLDGGSLLITAAPESGAFTVRINRDLLR